MISLVLRGGSFRNGNWGLYAALRVWGPPVSRFRSEGFRLVIRGQA